MRRSRIARAMIGAVAAAATAAATPAAALTLIRDAEIEATLKTLAGPIFKAAGLGQDGVDILIVADPTVNAFTTGGAKVFLYTGLLQQLETPEALIGVIAHEVGHIAGGHLSQRRIASENLTGPALIASIIGAAAGAAAGSGGAATGLALLGQSTAQRSILAFSRGQEASADQAGMSYMEQAGYDPSGVLEVMAGFRGQEVFASSRIDPYLRTHPLSTDRIAFVEQRIAASPTLGRKLSEDLVYRHARMRAKLESFLDRPELVLDRVGAGDDELSRLRRAVAYFRLPDQARAIVEVDRLIALRPDDPYYQELKGQILLENGSVEAAVAPLRRAVALAPREPLITALLGQALFLSKDGGDQAEALLLLERAATSDPANASVRRYLALAYAQAGDEAMASLVTAERFALSGRMDDAERQAKRAVAGLPEGSPGWIRAQDILTVAKYDDD